jgi:hypothetical protein
VLNPLALATLHQIAGTAFFYLGQTTDADDAFTRAVAVAPSSRPDPALGEGPAASFEQVRARVMALPGAGILLDAEGGEAWVDGRAIEGGAKFDLVPGRHWLQWRAPGGPLRTLGETLRPGQVLEVGVADLGDGWRALPEPPPLTGASEPHPVRLALRIGGVAAAGAGATLLGFAALSHDAFESSTDPAALAGLQARTDGLALAGLAAGVLGAGALGASFAVEARW